MALFNRPGSRWGRRISDLVQDLHTLEINTIQKAGMTARRMPPVPTALAEISENYRRWLRNQLAQNSGLQHSEALQNAIREATGRLDRWPSLDRLTDKDRAGERAPDRKEEFYDISKAARVLDEQAFFGEAGPSRIICQRIWRNAAYLYSLVEATEKTSASRESGRAIAPVPYIDWEHAQATEQRPGARSKIPEAQPTKLSLYNLVWIRDELLEKAWNVAFEDRAKIRKIWEVGTETVLVQTAIQLEGDVITRIAQQLADNDPGNIMKVHQQSIETAMGMWSSIIDAVIRFVEIVSRRAG